MAVYFEPKRNRVTINDILFSLGGQFVSNMLARDQAARHYKYADRLAASADERKNAFEASKIDEERAYKDRSRNEFMEAYGEVPGGIPGVGRVLGYAPDLGYTGNIDQMAQFLMPKQQTVNLGDRQISRSVYPDGTGGEESSWAMGVDPAKAQELILKEKENEVNAKYKMGMLANDSARMQNGRASTWRIIPGYTDKNGNLVERDQFGNTRTVTDIAPYVSDYDRKMQELALKEKASGIYKNFYGTNGSNGQSVVDIGVGAGTTTPQMNPTDFFSALGIPLGGKGGVPFEGYVPGYTDMAGGLEAYSRRLNSGSSRRLNSGSALTALTDDNIRQYAASRNISVEAAHRELARMLAGMR